MTARGGCPPVIDGLRGPATPRRPGRRRRHRRAGTTAPSSCREAFGEVRHRAPARPPSPPPSPSASSRSPPRRRVGLAPPRRRQPGAGRARARCSPRPPRDPDADVLGPKLREWPSLRRLLEVGVTISGTGRRETGLERGEYDQGQHDEVRPVLAVNTAGMLVRRAVLDELGGFDQQLPIFGNDIDFGWRAAAGRPHDDRGAPGGGLPRRGGAPRRPAHPAHRAAHPLPGATRRAVHAAGQLPRRGRCPGRSCGSSSARCCGCSGSCLVRSVGESLDELAAAAVALLPARPGAGRPAAAGSGGRPASPHDVRRLLAPSWLPYRHGLDFVSDLAAAA